jgi:hypothetical protein
MPSKCSVHEKNSGSDAQVSNRTGADYDEAGVIITASHRRFWEKVPVETDAHRDGPRAPYGSRESWGAEAFVYGCRIRPEDFVSDEASGDSYLSSRELIRKSHKLIAASRQRVRRINADVALRQRPRERIN